MLTRRRFFFLAPAAASALVAQRSRAGDSRLRARMATATATATPGEQALGLGPDRDGLLRIPSSYRADRPAPLAVLLHGAGGRARRIVSLLGIAESLGIVVLAPESRGGTWDAVRDDFGPDVEFISRALEYTFERVAVHRRKIAIGGFSDGATYALSLGADNGDLFTHILAFSPGFMTSRKLQGRPRIFISHGRQDEILPVAATSRRIVPALEGASYEVTYREFDGPHTVPASVAHEAFTWFTR